MAASPKHDRNSLPAKAKPFAARFMAVDNVEWQVIQSDPRLYREILFHVHALCLCTASFGFAIHNVTINLLGYSQLTAALFAAAVAFGLYLIDKHFLIQGRGATDSARRHVNKIRFLSLIIIIFSFMLMATSTFKDDIDRFQHEAGLQAREILEKSPRHALELAAASDAVHVGEQGVKRRDALQRRISDLNIERLRALENSRNECQGNTTGNQTREFGCGPKARGHQAAADRLGEEIRVATRELEGMSTIAQSLAKAHLMRTEIESRIDQEVTLLTSGPSKKLEAVFQLISSDVSALFVVFFWILIGLIPDLLMFIAQGRTFNHDLFAQARKVQSEVLQAELAKFRVELRQRRADDLHPIEVRIAAVPQPITLARPANVDGHLKAETASQGPS